MERIRESLSFTDREFAEYLRLTTPQLERLRERQQPPSIAAVTFMLEHLNLSMEHLRTGVIDYVALAAHAKKDFMVLPERYTTGAAFSRRRTSSTALEFLGRVYGMEMKHRLLKRFQAHEAAFQNPELPINVRFIWDICDALAHEGVAPVTLEEMGRFGPLAHAGSPVSVWAKQFGKPQDLYEQLPGMLTRYYERNHIYDISSLSKQHCTLRSVINPELNDAFSMRRLGSPAACSYRLGAAASFPAYAGLSAAVVYESRCRHRGDPFCEFYIDFEKAYLQSQSSRWRHQSEEGPLAPLLH